MRYPKYPQRHLPRVFDTSFDYKTDTPRTKPDPDSARSGTPATTPEYIEYRENVLAFIKKRSSGWPSGSKKTRRD